MSTSKRILQISGPALTLFLFASFFLIARLPDIHHHYQANKAPFPIHVPTSWHKRTADHRIAIILLYTSSGKTKNPADVVPHLTTFCAGAAGGRNLVDFLIFHTGVLDAWPLLAYECPSNVRLINLESTRGLAERLVRVVESPTMNRDEMIGLVESYIQANPYALVEFKPAFGYIFSDHLDSYYTHWGYSDFDILFGDLSRWITEDELTEFDIVTYSFGDQNRLYLRGQFTFHKISVAELWRECKYLTAMDERFEKIIKEKETYRVESAEGCYSAAVMNRNDLKVKFAVKAWTDIQPEDSVYSHGVYFSRRLNLIYKVDKHDLERSGRAASSLPANWFEKDDTVYKNPKIPLQREIGEREVIELNDDPNAKCMYWAIQKYQKRLCLKDQATALDTVFWIDGKLYKQRYQNAELDAPVLTAPFFHFQEWKRSYRFDQLATLTLSSTIDRFVLTPEGAIPMVNGKSSPRVPSPLGLKNMKEWTGERWQLPRNSYCIIPKPDDGRNSHHYAVSWQMDDVEIVSSAPSWTDVHVDFDVSLVLTLQVTVGQLHDPKTLSNVFGFIENCVALWREKPCVLLISIPNSDPRAKSIVTKLLGSMHPAAFIALVSAKEMTSRKALLNMAIDVVPTRWYVSGVEWERGIALSTETVAIAHRAAYARHRLRGQVLIVPQFGLRAEHTGQGSSFSLSDALLAQEKGVLGALHDVDPEACPQGNSSRTQSIVDRWWHSTQGLKTGSKYQDIPWVRALENIEEDVLAHINDPVMVAGDDESPILLTDNLSPQYGVLTHEVAREVENLSGFRCFNTLRFTQLVTFGYMFDILGGSFAVSSESTRKTMRAPDLPDRCGVCTLNHREVQKAGMTAVARAAKTAIIWMEE